MIYNRTNTKIIPLRMDSWYRVELLQELSKEKLKMV